MTLFLLAHVCDIVCTITVKASNGCLLYLRICLIFSEEEKKAENGNIQVQTEKELCSSS